MRVTFSAAKGSLTKKISISIKFPHAILLFIFYVKPLKEPVHFFIMNSSSLASTLWPVLKIMMLFAKLLFSSAFISFKSGPFLSLPLSDFVYE
jgi:hypothetical protein